ncbi:MAG: hypothetical protein K2L82_15575 [Lachnospiraceae bacterium]|nr:hypothetical protein [Lachnospiraceae bacterium]
MKKRETDNPNSWVFERGIGITIGDVYNLKGNKRRKIVRIVFSLLLLVGYFLLSNYYGNALKWAFPGLLYACWL